MARGNITALAIGADSINWTTIREDKNDFSVINSQRIESGIPSKLDDDTSEQVATILKNECHDLKGSLTLGLTSEQLLLRVIDFPSIDNDELTSMIDLQVDKFSPFPVDDMVVSHEILRQDDTTSSVLVAVAQKNILETLGTLLRKSGISIERIDAQALAWWHILKNAQSINEYGRQIILIMDGAIPEIIVTETGMPIAFRSLGDISGLPEDEFGEEIVREIGHTLMSLELEHRQTDQSVISICSKNKLPVDLVENLTTECSCEINTIPFSTLPSISEGLAQRSMKGALLDLRPPAWHVAGESKEFKKRFILTGCILLGLWLIIVGGFLGVLYLQKQRLAKLNKQVELLREPALKVSDMRSRVRVIKRYMDRTHSPLECIRELSILQPKGIDLVSLTYQKGAIIKINGEALDVNLIYDFSNKLNKSELFKKTVLHGPRYDRSKKKQVFDIEIHLPGEE